MLVWYIGECKVSILVQRTYPWVCEGEIIFVYPINCLILRQCYLDIKDLEWYMKTNISSNIHTLLVSKIMKSLETPKWYKKKDDGKTTVVVYISIGSTSGQ